MIHIAGEMAIINRPYRKICPGARFSKVPKTLRARKAVRKSPTHLFCISGLFICCKGNKNENNFKVSCLETLPFSRYKENYVTRNAPEKFRDFRETGPWLQAIRCSTMYISITTCLLTLLPIFTIIAGEKYSQ